MTQIPDAVNQNSRWFAAGKVMGSLVYGFSHPYSNIDDALAAAAFNNIPIGRGSVRVGRDQWQVHAEIGGSGEGEVHVQSVYGPNKGTKYSNPAEMPRALRDNAEIQRRLQKAQELLEKLKKANQ